MTRVIPVHGTPRLRGRRLSVGLRSAGARAGSAVGVILFAIIVLGISVVLVRSRPPLSAAVRMPSALGDATAGTLVPITRSARLPLDGSSRVRVALVRDPASESYFGSTAAYDRALDAWAALLEETGAEVIRLTPSAAESDPSAVLMVAATPCLSNPARRAMLTAASRGRGVIFTGLSGVRDGGCREVGWGLLADLVGAARADTVRFTPEQYVTVPGGSPLALDVPPGARIELKPAPHVVVRRAGRAAYYSDRDLNPLSTGETALLDGALVHDISGGRRVVYFGFEPATIVDRDWEQAVMRLLVRNAIALAAGIPIASPDAWPAGHAAAAVIAQDVEDEFENARGAVDTLRAARAPGTFFVVSDLAKRHEALTRAMASVGEIGTHTENHVVLGGTVEMQRARLATTQSDLTALLGRPVRGMRPPEERFDASSLAAWKEVGGTYVFGANDGRSPSPEIVDVGGAPFVLIGRTVDDDFLTVRRSKILEPRQLAIDQLHAADKVRALGGLFVMSYHSNMLAREQTIAALGIVARALKADTTIWLTTAGDAAEWWLTRHRLETTAVPHADGGLSLTVRNASDRPSPAAAVTVTLPRGRRAVAAAEADLIPSQPGIARVRIPPLVAGGSSTIRLMLQTETPDVD